MTLHLIFASLWIGGMIFMAVVLSPIVRKLDNSVELFKKVGIRYSVVGTFIGLPILFITGLCNTHYLGFKITDIFTATKEIPYLFTLKHKIYLFFLTVLISVIHDLYFGLRSDRSNFYRITARVLGILNLMVGILILFLASQLRFGN